MTITSCSHRWSPSAKTPGSQDRGFSKICTSKQLTCSRTQRNSKWWFSAAATAKPSSHSTSTWSMRARAICSKSETGAPINLYSWLTESTIFSRSFWAVPGKNSEEYRGNRLIKSKFSDLVTNDLGTPPMYAQRLDVLFWAPCGDTCHTRDPDWFHTIVH